MRSRGTPFKPWTAQETELVRANFREKTHAELGHALGRSAGSVKAFCGAHGFIVKRARWTDAELSIVRDGVAAGETSASILSRLPGRTLPMVGRQRSLLGLTRRLDTTGLDSLIRSLHADGWSDGEIVGEWNRGRDADSQINREAVSEHRRKIGLPSNACSQRAIERVRRKTAEQVRNGGFRSLADLKAAVIRKRIEEMGWPGDLRWREAQILSLIWERGPMTKRELADAVGDRRQANALFSNGKGGSHMATLMRRGLLITFKRAVKTGRRSGNVDLYSLNPFTIQRRNSNAGTEQQGPEREGAHQTGRIDRQSDGRATDGTATLAGGTAERDLRERQAG